MSHATGPVMDFDTLRRAMAENNARPEGPARNARAEALLAEAEKLGIPLAVIEALGHQLQTYNYSSEKDKMFVPFARLLRMWDERPDDFDAYETHSLHWVFKWMSAGMLGQPHIPLASIEKWLSEMERRYRIAGHSERAVRGSEYSVARHIGDLERAERAYTAWLAADRDDMSDCHACELHDQASWKAYGRHDAEALELWRPVLDGEYTCAHEPHAALASTLIPLVRLGRADEARAHHLRGLRLVRSMESMRSAYAQHVEFCALTGNEARALELLAERPAYFTDTGDPLSRMNYFAVVTLLTDRLVALGLGEQPVPGPSVPSGRTWTAGELAGHARGEALALAALFDARNGTDHISADVLERMARQPLLDRLPLGVRTARPLSVPKAPVSVPTARDAAPESGGLEGLLVEARRLTEARHPDASRAWAAVDRIAREEGAELAARDRAEVADHEAMAQDPADLALFARAAELYEAAGDPAEAAEARARGAYTRALEGRVTEALAALAEPCARAIAEYEAAVAEAADGRPDRRTARHAASMLFYRARVLLLAVHQDVNKDTDEDATGGAKEPVEPSAEAAVTAVEEAVGRLLAVAERDPDDPRLTARAGAAQAMRAELASHGGDPETAAGLYARAADAYVAAGVPWYAVEPESRRAAIAGHLGDLDTAERAGRAALEHGGPFLEPQGHARLHLQLSDVLAATGRFDEASRHALEAAHWADEGGEGAEFGAWARHKLGGHLLRLGRYAEAAEVLEGALPDLTEETHGDGALVQTRWWLGDCLRELGGHREAAEQWLLAADIARGWPEQRDHAMLAHMAAEALGSAGLSAQADRAYERAAELWRSLGNTHGLVRSLRARAWLTVDTDADADGAGHLADAGLDEARALMEAALSACTEAVESLTDTPDAAGGPDDPAEIRDALVSERAQTHRQFGELLARARSGPPGEDATTRAGFEEALEHLERAVIGFGSLGAPARDDRTAAELAAGWLESSLGHRDRAAARARGVIAVYGDESDGAAAARRANAEELLEHTEE
ncbi:tetratricopeptide repeat protein [Streptomyces sp. NPDC091292]|uniref:tetratricopeptide repeat protein n=1 Tax=Streptomyces sp. NPDC091292 TaxID=3365991 RepID=UPI0037FB007B